MSRRSLLCAARCLSERPHIVVPPLYIPRGSSFRRGLASSSAAKLDHRNSRHDSCPSEDYFASESRDISTRLRALLSRPSSSRHPAPANLQTVLKIIDPIYDSGDRTQLDPFLHSIASLLSPWIESSLNSKQVDEIRINDILAYCWIRSNQLGRRAFTSVQLTEIARLYARRIIRQAQNATTCEPLLAHFEESLEGYQKITHLLPPSIYAAWAVLRYEAAQMDPPSVRFVPANQELVLKALRDLLVNQDVRFEQYVPFVTTLLRSTVGTDETEVARRLPDDPGELESTLATMRVARDTTGAVELWEQLKKKLDRDQRSELKEPERQLRSRQLSSFLRFFSRSVVTRAPTLLDKNIEILRQEVLKRLPRPYPSLVYHTMLSHRARMDTPIADESASTEARELDIKPTEFKDKNEVLKHLEDVWRQAGVDNARDLKSYMLYMEGLAKLGEARRLGLVWEQVVRDETCRDIYQQEHGSDATFPPTRLINHMISCAFLIPKDGPEIGLDLFQQVIQPNSAIQCDLVTINTVLRHHARKGDIKSMVDLFPLAASLGLKPDVVTYTVLLQGVLRARDIRMAVQTLETMHKQGIPPNERTIGLLISDLARDGDRRGLRAAEDLLKQMQMLKMKITEVPWTALISGYFRGGWDKDGWIAIKRMEAQRVKLNRVGYNMVLRELGKRVQPEMRTLALREKRDPEGQEETLLSGMFKRMTETVAPNSDTYLLTLTPLVRAQRWKEADMVVADMKQRGYIAEKSGLRAVLNRVKERKPNWD